MAMTAGRHNLFIQDHHWDRLADEMSSGKLIPILGTELLRIDVNGEQVDFYAHIANQIALELGIEQEGLSLRTLTEYYQRSGGHPIDIYYLTEKHITSTDWSTCEPLRKLSEIVGNNLYVSLCPDDLLAKAVNQTLAEDNLEASVLSYAPKTQWRDVPLETGHDMMLRPVIYKLFGDVAMRPDFVMTEDNLLNFVHHLQIRDERPENLFDLLRTRTLAVLGCSFANWLIRFFYCSAKGPGLFNTHGVQGVVADRSTREDKRLTPFLEDKSVLLYGQGDGVDFVDKLHKKWSEKHARPVSGNASMADQSIPGPDGYTDDTDTVFISYASEDRAAAETIWRKLKQAGITVWMDQDKLEGGQLFENTIRGMIRDCVIFVPLISKHTISTQPRFFRLEWNLAIEESRKWPDTHPYIQPIVIDQTAPTETTIPQEFRIRHWEAASAGRLDTRYVNNLLKVLRRQQRRANQY